MSDSDRLLHTLKVMMGKEGEVHEERDLMRWSGSLRYHDGRYRNVRT